MNRFMKGLVCGVIGLGGIASSGCTHDGQTLASRVSDPCWPDRYAGEARERQVAQFEPQVTNGHILDQTIWNIHFEAGSEKLNAAGMDKLDQLARRRPTPDPVLYLQTTRDIAYDSDKPNDYVTKRGDLDSKRVASIQKYLGSTLSGRPTNFTVQIHDPSYPGIDGAAPRVVLPSPNSRVGLGSGGNRGGQQGGGQQGAPNMGGGNPPSGSPAPAPAPSGPGM